MGKGGRAMMYKDPDVKAYEESAVYQLKSQYQEKPIDRHIRMEIDFWVHRVKDIDNMQGSVLDSLEQAGVILNDNRIVDVRARRYKLQKGDGEESVDLKIYAEEK